MEQTITEAPKRPQFLQVLCILTFIGVGFGILGSIFGWWTMRRMEAMMNGTAPMPEGMEDTDMSEFPGMAEAMIQLPYINITTTVTIISCLMCLAGALLMWKLKKTGFYIYVIGEIAPLIISVILMGTSILAGWAIMGIIIPVVFIILYAMNLKHLK